MPMVKVSNGGSAELYYVCNSNNGTYALGDTITLTTGGSGPGAVTIGYISIGGKASSITFTAENYFFIVRKTSSGYSIEHYTSGLSGTLSNPSTIMCIILESGSTANYSFTISWVLLEWSITSAELTTGGTSRVQDWTDLSVGQTYIFFANLMSGYTASGSITNVDVIFSTTLVTNHSTGINSTMYVVIGRPTSTSVTVTAPYRSENNPVFKHWNIKLS